MERFCTGNEGSEVTLEREGEGLGSVCSLQ